MKNNLFSNIPASLPEEAIDILVSAPHITIERIVSRGHCSEKDFWYDQEKDEFVVLLAGEAQLRFEEPDEEVDLRPGDYLMIPKHRRHRVESTSFEEDCVWLAVFLDSESGQPES